MKKTALTKRAAALLMALVWVAALAPTAQAGDSEAYGNEVWLQDTVLQDGVVLSDNLFWSGYYDKPRHEYYITYTPGGAPVPGGTEESSESPAESVEDAEVPPDETDAGEDPRPPDSDMPAWLLPDTGRMGASAVSCAAPSGVIPTVYYGFSVCDRNSAATAAQVYENQGYRVLGIINGDFYNTGSGSPLGLLVSNGEMLSSCGGLYALGFRADGSAVIGQPQVSMTIQAGERSQPLLAVNKSDNAGITMWTYAFRSDHTTGGILSGPEVIATVLEGRAAIGGQMTVQVAEVAEGEGRRTLEEGQIALSTPGDGNGADLDFLRSLTPGQTLTISCSSPDPQWNEVTEAIGGLYLLVEDGVPQTGFEVSAAPRTAVGVKADGSVVLYTVDGRQSKHSMGASLGVLAQRMAELGCVTALCMDGGGSTTLMASTPDGSASRLINSPSDGSPRRVSNLIALLAPGGATGVPHAIHLSAGAPAVMPGHTVSFTANLVDSHYYPMEGEIQFTSSAGTMEGGILTAPEESGVVTVTASYGEITAQAQVLVTSQPDGALITRDGSAISALTLKPEQAVQLGGSVTFRHRTLEADASDFSWWISPELGTIDENGLVTAVRTSEDAFGYIVATIGDCTVRIEVSVRAVTPFVDTVGHWAEEHMTRLYYQDVLRGTEEEGGLYAYPDRGVTRAEFAVLLCRYLGIDPAEYAALETPFADLDQVDGWALDSVRAMYALEIIKGSEVDGQTVFDPRGTLTRSQAVTMLDRMLSLDSGNSEPELPEVPAFIGLNPLPEDGEEEGVSTEEEPPAEEIPQEEEPGQDEPGQSGEEPPEEPAEAGVLDRFEDAAEIPEYAVEHFQSLVALGVIEGSGSRLEPNATMTRAAICKVLDTLP